MKKQLLAIAVSAAAAAPMAAMAQPEVYGRFDVTLQKTESLSVRTGSQGTGGQNSITGATSEQTITVGTPPNTGTFDLPGNGRFNGSDTGDQWETRSNTSVLGIRGSQELDASMNMDAIYQLEMEFTWVDDAEQNFVNRNSFVGLQGEDWGRVFVGRYDSIIKQAEFSVDQFNYTDADIAILLRNQNRYNNTVNYASPKFGPGLQFKAQVIPGESRQNFDGDDRETTVADGFGASIGIEEGNIYGAIAYETKVETAGDAFSSAQLTQFNGQTPNVTVTPSQDLDVQTFRVSGGLDGDRFGAGFIWDQTEISGPDDNYDDEKSGWLLSGRFNPMDRLAVKAQYGDSETRFHALGDQDDRSITSATLGADYRLGKQTKVYTFYSMNEVDDDIPTNNSEDDSEFNVLAFGMQHRF